MDILFYKLKRKLISDSIVFIFNVPQDHALVSNVELLQSPETLGKSDLGGDG